MAESMRFELVDDPAAFSRVVEPELMRDPALNTVPLSVLSGILAGRYPDHLLAHVLRDGEVAAVGIRTPPFRLVVAAARTDAVFALADGLLDAGVDLPGVSGVEPAATASAARWSGRVSCRLRQDRGLRLFRADDLTAVRPAGGLGRTAIGTDARVLVRWTIAYCQESGALGPADLTRDIGGRIEERRLSVWEDGVLTSMAGRGQVIGGTARIGPVYTPSELRGRGCASNLVAQVSREILAEGGVPVLFTDLANPTSNAIYAAIGYRRVCDAREIAFLPDVVH